METKTRTSSLSATTPAFVAKDERKKLLQYAPTMWHLFNKNGGAFTLTGETGSGKTTSITAVLAEAGARAWVAIPLIKGVFAMFRHLRHKVPLGMAVRGHVEQGDASTKLATTGYVLQCSRCLDSCPENLFPHQVAHLQSPAHGLDRLDDCD